MFVPRNPLTRQREYFTKKEDVEKAGNSHGAIDNIMEMWVHRVWSVHELIDKQTQQPQTGKSWWLCCTNCSYSDVSSQVNLTTNDSMSFKHLTSISITNRGISTADTVNTEKYINPSSPTEFDLWQVIDSTIWEQNTKKLSRVIPKCLLMLVVIEIGLLESRSCQQEAD